jgi:DNA mismatch endonuclease (patch repair protein)
MHRTKKSKSEVSESANSAKTIQSWAATPAVRRVMQGNKSRDTKPEIAVRCAVHAMGMRYRVAARPLVDVRRTADLVFRRARVAVFVDGCFWHGCPSHHTSPKTNTGYWTRKIEGNNARDRDTTALLKTAGWTVLRFWSHEEPQSVATRIVEVIRSEHEKTVAMPTKKRSGVCR